MKKIAAIGIIFFGMLIYVPKVLAADLAITYTDSGCTVSPLNGAIFYETDIKPLDTITRILSATNTDTNPASVVIDLKDLRYEDDDPPLGDILHLTITDSGSGAVIYGPTTIAEWKTADPIVLAVAIPAGETREYVFQVMVDNVGNEYQMKTLAFDARLTCWGGTDDGSVLPEEGAKKDSGSILGEITQRLPATGQSLLLASFGLILMLFGRSLKNKRTK